MGSEPFTTAASQPGGAEPGQSFLEKHRSWVLRFTFVAGAIFVYLVSERSWLQSEQAALAKELAHDQIEGGLARAGFARADSPYRHFQDELLPDIKESECKDKELECKKWAAAGECLNNPKFMIGHRLLGPGSCLASCGLCSGKGVELPNLGVDNGCKDLSSSCAALRDAGMCEKDPSWMLGEGDKQGQCMRSCGGCEQKGFKASFDIRPAEGGKEGGASSWLEGASYAQQAECMDLSSNCKGWAAEGMCEDNRSYMIGDRDHDGQCRRSCKVCGPEAKAPEEPGPAIKSILPGGSFEDMPLKWPTRVMVDTKVCIGITTTACQRGLWEPEVSVLRPKDRARVSPGVGGPTGCKEAWATLIQQDQDLPGVLVHIFSIRKHSKVDRDIIVFVAGNVTSAIERRLQDACVLVMRVAEPYNPHTHIGFNKLSLWLVEEYEKIAFFAPTVWFRRNPDTMFDNSAPAAVQAPKHPRVVHDVFNAGAFLLKPSRETFFDMLTKAGMIDSAEKMEDGSVIYLDTLFFSGYFVHWTTVSSALVEHEAHLVNSLHHEATNKRLHFIIKAAPPYAPYTILDYSMIQAAGIQNAVSVPPWNPGWRIPCAYPCTQRTDQGLWEAVSEEWWHYYYDLVGLELPPHRSAMRLLEPHDPLKLFDKHEYEHCLPFNCGVPNEFEAKLDAFEDVLRMVREQQDTSALLNIKKGPPAKHGNHGRRLQAGRD